MGRPNLSVQRRKRLIPKIARAFAELGYRRATTAELARRCGVQENILYRLWPDKKAMFIAAIDWVYELSAGIWEGLTDGAEAGSRTAEKLLEYEAIHHGEFGLYRILFAGLNEAGDPEIARALRGVYCRFQRFIEKQIAARVPGSRLEQRLEPALVAWAFIGLGTVANIGRELGFIGDDVRSRLIGEIGRRLLDVAS